MFLSKLKAVLAITVAVAFIATGAGVLAFQESGGRAANKTGDNQSSAKEAATNPVVDTSQIQNLPKPDQAAKTPAAPPGQDRRLDKMSEEVLANLQDELELLRIHLEAKQAEYTGEQAQLSGAKHLLEQNMNLARVNKNGVSRIELLNSQTALSMQDARLKIKAGEVREAELRIRQAERRLKNAQASGGLLIIPPLSSAVPSADWEGRLRDLEQKVNQLRTDLDALRREPRR